MQTPKFTTIALAVSSLLEGKGDNFLPQMFISLPDKLL